MHSNRLALEKSPYLLQHAHNPVDWYAWGGEAFAKARAEDKPIFLSIGYSTCHWCHVMERESFENAVVAAQLNRDFVPIKVDREERPDVDRIYMSFVQAATGGGGWPMSVWLTPELEPFFGGTYFPPEDRWGHAGFSSVLTQIAQAWRSDRDRIGESARQALAQLEKQSAFDGAPAGSRAPIDYAVIESGFSIFRRTYDSEMGGFGPAPKFPRPAVFEFLLRYHARTGNREALEMTLHTLRKMAEGGMNDQLGGGFHRYSVDERWFVPHFEKMLYDQAQLATSYLEAFQITGEKSFAETARRIFDYLLRDMTAPEGGCYSAEDADSVIRPEEPSVKGEGAFYIWSADEIRLTVPAPAAEWFAYRYGVAEGGNVVNDPHSEFSGRNILYRAASVEETAEQFGRPVDEVRAGLEAAEAALLKARASRVRPHLDDKILTAWNGLMISALALGGAVLEEPRYAKAARRAADFALSHLFEPETGQLLRRYRDGEAAFQAFSKTTPCSRRRCSICTRPSSTGATWNGRCAWPKNRARCLKTRPAADSSIPPRMLETSSCASRKITMAPNPAAIRSRFSTCCASPKSPGAWSFAPPPSAPWPPSPPAWPASRWLCRPCSQPANSTWPSRARSSS